MSTSLPIETFQTRPAKGSSIGHPLVIQHRLRRLPLMLRLMGRSIGVVPSVRDSSTNRHSVSTQKDYISSTLTWGMIQGKPQTFTPSPHTHPRADVTDFFATPFWNSIPDKPSTFPPSLHSSSHSVGGGDPLSGALDANARVTVRKNSGANAGSRRRLNFIEGSNVTLTVSDNPANEEVDITIAASGGSLSYVHSNLASDLALENSNQWYSGPSVSLTSGTWLVIACALIWRPGTGVTRSVAIRLYDGTNTLRTVQAIVLSNTPSGISLACHTIVTVTANTTVTLQAATSSGSVSELLKATGVMDSGPATAISAIKIA